MNNEVKEKISGLIHKSPVVLFMKGNRQAPQCGFSAKVVQVLDGLIDDYQTVDVLSDQAIREGIKEYSQWPTIPQLYIRGEFLGGSDIVSQLYASGELQKKLGVTETPVKPPALKITASAMKAIRAALADAPGDVLHLAIDNRFQHQLDLAPKSEGGAGGIEVVVDGLSVWLDPASAKRADGLTIDFIEGPKGSGFKMDNPKAPVAVQQIGAKAVKAKLDAGEKLRLIDVRTESEWQTAHVPGFTLLSDANAAEFQGLDQATPLYFMCHHGGRSQRMAEQFRDRGFRQVFNIAGGIDAWSLEVDNKIPRY